MARASGPFYVAENPTTPPPKCSPGISNFMFPSLFPPKVPREHSPAASSKAEKYNMQNFTKIQSFGTAGNEGGPFRKNCLIYSIQVHDHLPIIFQGIPVQAGHQEPYVTSHSGWIPLQTFLQTAALKQTS